MNTSTAQGTRAIVRPRRPNPIQRLNRILALPIKYLLVKPIYWLWSIKLPWPENEELPVFMVFMPIVSQALLIFNIVHIISEHKKRIAEVLFGPEDT